MSYQRVIINGNVGADPEIRSTNNNKVASLRIATSERYTDRSGNAQEKTEWHSVVVWGKKAEIIEKYVKKGDKILVEGKLSTRKFTTQAGDDRSITEIIADTIDLPPKKKVDDLPVDEPF